MTVKQAGRSFAQRSIKELSYAAGRVQPELRGVTVLIYHRVGCGTSSLVDSPLDTFARHLDILRADYRVIRLDEAIDAIEEGREADGVVVTFDDGTSDFVEHALPLLASFEIPATLYLATGFVDGARRWPDDCPPLSLAGVQESVASGWVDIESHTHRHLLLDRLSTQDVRDELDRSIDLIGEWTGRRPNHFAYPKAVPPGAAADVEVRQRFRSAALATAGVNRRGTDVHALRRTPIQRTDQERHFRAKCSGGMKLETAARQHLSRLRYRKVTG